MIMWASSLSCGNCYHWTTPFFLWFHYATCYDIFFSMWLLTCSGVRMLALSVVNNRGFESQSGQIKDYKIGICCFSAEHAALKIKSNDWLARNQDNMCKWGDMSIRGLLLQWASTIKKKMHVGLVQSGPHHHHLWKFTFSHH